MWARRAMAAAAQSASLPGAPRPPTAAKHPPPQQRTHTHLWQVVHAALQQRVRRPKARLRPRLVAARSGRQRRRVGDQAHSPLISAMRSAQSANREPAQRQAPRQSNGCGGGGGGGRAAPHR